MQDGDVCPDAHIDRPCMGMGMCGLITYLALLALTKIGATGTLPIVRCVPGKLKSGFNWLKLGLKIYRKTKKKPQF